MPTESLFSDANLVLKKGCSKTTACVATTSGWCGTLLLKLIGEESVCSAAFTLAILLFWKMDTDGIPAHLLYNDFDVDPAGGSDMDFLGNSQQREEKNERESRNN